MSREREERFAEPGRGFRDLRPAATARVERGSASLCLRL